MFSKVLGELSDHSENIFKLSRRKLLFIFCIFLMYKIISISFDLTIINSKTGEETFVAEGEDCQKTIIKDLEVQLSPFWK